MGLSSSSDEWCRHSDRVVEGFPWCKKIVDDILIWEPNPQDLEECMRAVVARCDHLHVTLSCSKFQIATSLNFAGCIVSNNGVQPNPSRISSLTDFPVPRDQTGVRSFLGLCNQLAFFIPDYKQHLKTINGQRAFFSVAPRASSGVRQAQSDLNK